MDTEEIVNEILALESQTRDTVLLFLAVLLQMQENGQRPPEIQELEN